MKKNSYFLLISVIALFLLCPTFSNAQKSKRKTKPKVSTVANPQNKTAAERGIPSGTSVAPSADIAAARTAVWVSTEHSKTSCTRLAHQICDQIFGKCTKSNEAALGGEAGYLIMYQCHDVKMTYGGVTVMVIAGSRTEGTNSAKLTEWMTLSHSLARKLFEQ